MDKPKRHWIPNPNGRPKGSRSPQTWAVTEMYPDKSLEERTRLQAMYRAWVQQRNQAAHRNDEWDFEFEPWWQMWDPYWDKKRHEYDRRYDYLMYRIDSEKPWHQDNATILHRTEAGKRNQMKRYYG